MSLHLSPLARRASITAASTAVAAAVLLVPGIIADAQSPVPAGTRAEDLLLSALLPNQTVKGFVDAALDGSGQKSRLASTLQGMGGDLFELAVNPGKALVVLTR